VSDSIDAVEHALGEFVHAKLGYNSLRMMCGRPTRIPGHPSFGQRDADTLKKAVILTGWRGDRIGRRHVDCPQCLAAVKQLMAAVKQLMDSCEV
jgi:hypothetical protein